MSIWKVSINGATAVTLESLGITLVGGQFVSHAAGSVRLEIAESFSAASPVAYGDDVRIIRNDGSDVTFFRGKCRTVPRYGQPLAEGLQVEILDAWEDLAQTVYQEQWNAFQASGEAYVLGSPKLSRAVIGVTPTGARRTTAEMIEAVVDYAESAGVDITMGALPTGMPMIPREVDGRTCSEILMECLAQHPDWMTWMDYTTTKPTLHVVARATATTRSYAVDGSGEVESFSLTRRDDLKPKRVILNFESAGGIETEIGTARAITRDVYPPIGSPDTLPTEGPGVVVATMQLQSVAAVPASYQPAIIATTKTRIKVREIPTTQAEMKDWAVIKYPHLRGVPVEQFEVTVPVLELVDFSEDPPEPVDPESVPAEPATAAEIPNELVAGTIEDWMNKKTGRVRVFSKIRPSATATEANRKKILQPFPACIVVATNATTGLYTRVDSYTPASYTPGTPAEQAAPMAGLAQKYYEALHQNTYEGSVVLSTEELPTDRIAGCTINLTGGLVEWDGMLALVNSVEWDVESRQVTIGFGPPRWFTFADFIAMQEALRAPAGNPFAEDVRDSENVGVGGGGGEADISNIQGFNSPETIFEQIEDVRIRPAFEVYDVHPVAGGWKAKVRTGYVTSFDPTASSEVLIVPTNADADITVSSSSVLYCKVTTNKQDKPTSAEILTVSGPTNTHAKPDPSGEDGTYYYKLADFETVDDKVVVKNQYHVGLITHRPARNDRNLKVTIRHKMFDTNGNLVSAGDDSYLFFRQGLYVGATDPADSATQDEETVTNIAGS